MPVLVEGCPRRRSIPPIGEGRGGTGAETVPAPVSAMPRSAPRVNVAVVGEGPAVEGRAGPAVGEPGAVPRPVSAAMRDVPALIVVAPV